MRADFPFARSLIVVRSARTIKKTGQTSTESRYYLSRVPPQDYRPEQWLGLIRGHWGGVEVRNHWRRDALMGEDRSRSRNATLLAQLHPDQSLPQIKEHLHSRPSRCFALLNS